MSLSVSIVVLTYNRAHLIGRALSSAVSQLLPGDEVIVVDDGATDNTAEMIKSFGPAVRLISVNRVGAGRARNTGAALAKNDLVAFLDSDDEWMPNKLALQRAYLEACPEVFFCFSNFGKPAGTAKHAGIFWSTGKKFYVGIRLHYVYYR